MRNKHASFSQTGSGDPSTIHAHLNITKHLLRSGTMHTTGYHATTYQGTILTVLYLKKKTNCAPYSLVHCLISQIPEVPCNDHHFLEATSWHRAEYTPLSSWASGRAFLYREAIRQIHLAIDPTSCSQV